MGGAHFFQERQKGGRLMTTIIDSLTLLLEFRLFIMSLLTVIVALIKMYNKK